jgi:hypothetical protein
MRCSEPGLEIVVAIYTPRKQGGWPLIARPRSAHHHRNQQESSNQIVSTYLTGRFLNLPRPFEQQITHCIARLIRRVVLRLFGTPAE